MRLTFDVGVGIVGEASFVRFEALTCFPKGNETVLIEFVMVFV